MKRNIKTLDNRNIVLTTAPGEIIKQADIKMVQGEGMPTFRVKYNIFNERREMKSKFFRILSTKGSL